MEECSKFQKITIPNFSYSEFSNCVQHYSESGWFTKGEALCTKYQILEWYA